MTYAKWLRLTCILTVLGLIGTAAAVIVVDPFFHYHKPLTGFT